MNSSFDDQIHVLMRKIEKGKAINYLNLLSKS